MGGKFELPATQKTLLDDQEFHYNVKMRDGEPRKYAICPRMTFSVIVLDVMVFEHDLRTAEHYKLSTTY